MIIQPDFLEHWKTRLLVEMTADESAPLAVIRLWAHCQNAKRGTFPDMTPAQLASICRWGNRKPACHITLIKCGFIEKLSPRGFKAHEWADHNRQLIQKWEAGKNGGRPRADENPNETEQTRKPTDNRPITGRELDRTDGLELIDKIEKNRTDLKDAGNGGSSSGSDLSAFGSGSVQSPEQLVGSIVRTFTASSYPEGGEPTQAQVENVMRSKCKDFTKCAAKWIKTMQARGWKDHQDKPVQHWQPLAEAFASAWECNDRNVCRPTRPDATRICP